MKNQIQNAGAKVFFPNLDGLRTIAFLFVYIQHGILGSVNLLDIKSDFLNRLFHNVTDGGTGVSIFFVLSGFLITYLLLTELEIKGKIHIWFFYVRRILRIWPLYFAVLLFSIVIYPYFKTLIGINSQLAIRPLYYFTFLSNFDVINIQKFHYGADAMMQGITWSVAVEEQFYLVWPLLFVITPKRYFKLIFIFILVGCLIFRFVNRQEGVINYFHSLSVCGDLAIGGLVAYYSLFSMRFREFFSKISRGIILGIYILGVSWLLYGSLLLNSYTAPLFYRLGNTVFFAFVILEQNFSTNSFFKFSRSKTLTFWGKYTYGLYLLHPIALLILDVGLRVAKVPYKEDFFPFFSVGIVSLALSLAMSYLSYEYFEKHFLKYKDRFSFVHKTPKSKKKQVNRDELLLRD